MRIISFRQQYGLQKWRTLICGDKGRVGLPSISAEGDTEQLSVDAAMFKLINLLHEVADFIGNYKDKSSIKENKSC